MPFQKKSIYIILTAALFIVISYATAQPLQGHPWTEIILPSGNNIWTGLNADKLDGLDFSNFSGRLWSGYDPATNNIWYNDGGNVGIGTDNPQAKLDVHGRVKAFNPIDSNDLATKEYVDAAQSGQENSGTGGGAFVLVGGPDSTPTCPYGYSSAMDGYWVCGYSYSANNAVYCFCGEESEYNIYGYIHFYSNFGSDYSKKYRCAVCYPTPSYSRNIPVSSGSTVLWITNASHNGNFGGRSGLDSFCASNQPSFLKDKCDNVHAFVSVSSNDEIRDLPNCDPDGDGVMHNYYDCRKPVYWFDDKWNEYTLAGHDWKDILDGDFLNDAYSAGYNSNLGYWTGSRPDGSLYIYNCLGWTATGTGYYSYNSALGLSNGINRCLYYSNSPCNSNYPVLCVCHVQ